jgi:opacity protein-like surface antigen
MSARLASLLVAVALSASPAIAGAQTAVGGRSQWRLGALLGMEDGDLPSGLALRVDGVMEQKPLSPIVGLSFVLSFGYTRFHDEYNVYFAPYTYSDDWTANVFKFVPAARLVFGRNAKIRPYADAGVGFYYMSVSSDMTAPWGAVQSESSSESGLMFRFAGGLEFLVNDGMSIGGELGFNPYMGDFDDTTLTAMFAATFRL